MVLAAAVLMANLPFALTACGLGALALHSRARYPARTSLLIISGQCRFGLPVEGRFDLGIGANTCFGPFWAELQFSDRPTSRFLVVRDQMSEPDWRQLGLILREGL